MKPSRADLVRWAKIVVWVTAALVMMWRGLPGTPPIDLLTP